MPYRKAIVAVDMSEDSEQVLSAAREMRDCHAMELHLVSVVRPLAEIYGGMDMSVISPETLRLEEEAEKQARERLETMGAEAGAASVQLRHGTPAAEVRAAAEALDADLIIIGTHGRHGLGLLLGSTANGVLHGTPCDVLAVRIRN